MKLKKLLKKMDMEMNVNLNIKKKKGKHDEKIHTKVGEIPEDCENCEVTSIYKQDGNLTMDLKKNKKKRHSDDDGMDDSLRKMKESLKMVDDSNDNHDNKKEKKENHPSYRDNRNRNNNQNQNNRNNNNRPSRRVEEERKEILKDFAESKIKAAAEASDKKKEDVKDIEEKLSNPIEKNETDTKPTPARKPRNNNRRSKPANNSSTETKEEKED